MERFTLRVVPCGFDYRWVIYDRGVVAASGRGDHYDVVRRMAESELRWFRSFIGG